MQTDALGRTLPWETHDDPDEPRTTRFHFSAADYAFFEFILRHGYASSLMILEAQRATRKSDINVLKRLKSFCRGSVEQGKVLYAPDAQFSQQFAHARHKVYGLTRLGENLAAKHIIEETGRFEFIPPTQSNWFVHDLMQATVAGSFELTAKAHGLRYVPRSELLLHEYSGYARTSHKPMTVNYKLGKTIRFDDAFALEKDRKKTFCLLEVDRASETMRPKDQPKDGITYFLNKLIAIDELIESGEIAEWSGFAKPRILVVTTTGARAKQIIEEVSQLKHATKFYVTVVPEFRTKWRVPDHVLTNLLDDPWLTVEGPKPLIP